MDVCSSIELFDELRDDDLSFAYSGLFSDTITHRIVELTQYNIDASKNFVKLKNKISFLMVECYQNIVRHTDTAKEQIDDIKHVNAFFVRSIGCDFYITSVNYIYNDSIQNVKEKLDRVNSLSPDELRILQKDVLAKGRLSEKGGAGLGIIEMARKSGQKIEYSFDKVDEHVSLFYLHLKLHSQEEGVTNRSKDVSIEEMKVLHNKLILSNILIMHKGDFSEQSVLPIIQMIENFKKHSVLQFGKKRLFHISVEILQNISQHAYKKDGVNEAIFTFGKIDHRYIINTSNYVEKSKVESLRANLEHIKSLSKTELDMLFKEKFRSLNETNVHGIGLGLLDISRKCNKFDYTIDQSGEIPLFSLYVDV
jgi:hypothetical protein